MSHEVVFLMFTQLEAREVTQLVGMGLLATCICWEIGGFQPGKSIMFDSCNVLGRLPIGMIGHGILTYRFTYMKTINLKKNAGISIHGSYGVYSL